MAFIGFIGIIVGLLIEFVIFYLIFNKKCYIHGKIVYKSISVPSFWCPTSFMYLCVEYIDDNKVKTKDIKVDSYVYAHNEIGKTITILV